MPDDYGPDSDECEPSGYPYGVGVPQFLDDLLDVEVGLPKTGGTVYTYPSDESGDYGYAAPEDDDFAPDGPYLVGGIAEFPCHAWSRTPAVASLTPVTAVLWLPGYNWPTDQAIEAILYGVDEDDHTSPTDMAEWTTDHGMHTTAHLDLTFPANADSDEGASWGFGGFFCDPTAILAEIQARPGWVSGNDLGLHLDFVSGIGGIYNFFGDWMGPVLSLSEEAWPYPTGEIRFWKSAGTPDAINYPPDMVAGETVLCVILNGQEAGDDYVTDSVWPSGWTKLKELANGKASLHIGWHKVTGAEGATFTVSWTGSGVPFGWVLRIGGAADPDVTPPIVSTGATGSSTTPDPDAVSPGVGRNLFLALAARKDGWSTLWIESHMEIARSSYASLFWSDEATVDPDPLSYETTGLWAAATVCVFGVGTVHADNELLAYDSGADEPWIDQTAHEAGLQELDADAVEDNFASFDAIGQVQDSGYAPGDFAGGEHDHDAAYISIIAAPAENHFPYQTAGGELVDSGYDAGDFATDTHDHDALYPSKSAASYTVTNVTEDRAFDADSTTLDELADVLGTLIADLKATGIIT